MKICLLFQGFISCIGKIGKNKKKIMPLYFMGVRYVWTKLKNFFSR